MEEDRLIRVWEWSQAPDCYKRYSPHGGDEDWVALVNQRGMGIF